MAEILRLMALLILFVLFPKAIDIGILDDKPKGLKDILRITFCFQIAEYISLKHKMNTIGIIILEIITTICAFGLNVAFFLLVIGYLILSILWKAFYFIFKKKVEVWKGYKVFNSDWTCRDFQYKVGGTYTINDKPKVGVTGFHFCTELIDCFSYYSFNPNNKVAEIEAIGEIDIEPCGNSCTNKIKIVREVSWKEVLQIVNIGKDCTGYRNIGDYNSGGYNTGEYCIGDFNSGNYNSGNFNSGFGNSSGFNSGNFNSCGGHNSGNHNSGRWNSGDWNKTSFSSGCFNTKEAKILMFNKPSDWTYMDWYNSEARILLDNAHKNVEWIPSDDMTDEEKEKHPEHKIICGYLKKLDSNECAQIWWDKLTDNQKEIIRSIPNFDKEIFEDITGIKTD